MRAPRPLETFFGDDRDRAVQPDREDILDRFQIGVGAVVEHEGAVAAEAGRDHLAALGMLADVARQRQQRQRLLMIDAVGRPALGQAGTLCFLAVAALDVRSEAAGAQCDLLAGIGVLAEFLRAFGLAVLSILRAELARVVALGIVRAADEAAAFSESERQIAGAAFRADARLLPSARAGKSSGARSSFSASSTSEILRSLMSSTEAEKSRQKSRSTCL